MRRNLYMEWMGADWCPLSLLLHCGDEVVEFDAASSSFMRASSSALNRAPGRALGKTNCQASSWDLPMVEGPMLVVSMY